MITFVLSMVALIALVLVAYLLERADHRARVGSWGWTCEGPCEHERRPWGKGW